MAPSYGQQIQAVGMIGSCGIAERTAGEFCCDEQGLGKKIDR
jgi:hypothetical protein